MIAAKRLSCEWEKNWLKNPVQAYFATVKAVFLHPVDFFSKITPFESLLSLFTFFFLNQFAVMFVLFLLAIALKFALGFLPFLALSQQQEFVNLFFVGDFFFTVLFAILWLFFVPLIQVCVTVVITFVIHLFLTFLGGSQKDYMHTLTVFGLASATNLLVVLVFIPIVGTFVQAISQTVYMLIIFVGGMAEMHEISPGRVFLSYLIPGLVCCCCLGGFVVLAGVIPALIAIFHG